MVVYRYGEWRSKRVESDCVDTGGVLFIDKKSFLKAIWDFCDANSC